jgi:hypothetical protein
MSAGKGDAPRPVNGKVYRENFDAINWQRSNWQDEIRIPSHLEFMRSMGFQCKTEEEAYELRGLLDM